MTDNTLQEREAEMREAWRQKVWELPENQREPVMGLIDAAFALGKSCGELTRAQPTPAAGVVERVAAAIFEAYSSDKTAQEWARGTSWKEALRLAERSEAWKRIIKLAYKEARAALSALSAPSVGEDAAVEIMVKSSRSDVRGNVTTESDMRDAYRALKEKGLINAK